MVIVREKAERIAVLVCLVAMVGIVAWTLAFAPDAFGHVPGGF